MANERWWGVEHTCGGDWREYPILHWADEPEHGAGPRQAFECDACGDRYAFHALRVPFSPLTFNDQPLTTDLRGSGQTPEASDE